MNIKTIILTRKFSLALIPIGIVLATLFEFTIEHKSLLTRAPLILPFIGFFIFILNSNARCPKCFNLFYCLKRLDKIEYVVITNSCMACNASKD
jgi:hypothetical protein